MWRLVCGTLILISLVLSAVPSNASGNISGYAFSDASGDPLRWQKCNYKICYACLAYHAHCYTNSSMRTVPQDLEEKLVYLEIFFTAGNSSGGILYQNDVKRYRHLESLHLFRDFRQIDVHALETLENLSWLHLESTHIAFLPDHLLAQNTKFTNLQLILNWFTEIPFNIFPPNIARKVTQFTFHGHVNVTLSCSNGTMILPNKFSKFEALESLDIGYNIFKNESCIYEISESFFEPVANITSLSVEGTDLLYGRESALQRLRNLKNLDISFLLRHRMCPAKAGLLFDNIPATVVNLTVMHWETGEELKEDCFIKNPNVLSGLRRVKLQHLNFSRSDAIFGPRLFSSTIPKIETLKNLDLSDCRLNSIETDMLSKYSNLKSLNLAGNPLGPNNIEYVRQEAPQLKYLNLQGTNIRSDMFLYYDATNIICNFPNLKKIDFSSNDMRRLPRFNGGPVCNTTTSSKLEILFASNARIEDFVQKNISNNICLNFRNLKQLKMRNNLMLSLDGLEKCARLEILDVYQNHLYYGNHDTNRITGVLQQLRHIKQLNLGFNGFRIINSSLLYNMPKLKQFYFNQNSIQCLDENFFSRNPNLAAIDLSNNYLPNLPENLFKDLVYLEYLDLRGNLISTLSPHFLNGLDWYKHLDFFGFGNNPYDCDCNKTYFQTWLKEHPYFTGSGEDYILCDSPLNLRGVRVIDYTNNLFQCKIKTPLLIGSAILAGFLVTLLIALPCYKHRWYVRHARLVWRAFKVSVESEKLEKICPYDAFVSYDPNCENDCMWVAHELRRAMEEDREPRIDDERPRKEFKLYLEHRDALAGSRRYTQKEIALQKSKRILIVVSNSYLRSGDCLSETDLSGLRIRETEFYQPNRVMLLIREDLSEEIIRPPMSSLLLGKTLKVNESNPRRKELMWQKIRDFLALPLYASNKHSKLLTERSPAHHRQTTETVEASTESTPLLQ